MKIDKINKIYGKYIDTSTLKDKAEKTKDINIKQEKSVDVQISKSAKELVRQIEKSKNTDFSERVEKIRQAILDGKYKVSSEKIADKILSSIESQEDNEIE